jgi:DNA-directed RNA polymerase specialized sigma24 family protein
LDRFALAPTPSRRCTSCNGRLAALRPLRPALEATGRAAVILAGLPESYRRILQLRFLDSCSVREAAASLGVSVTYAKVLQHRALRRAAQLVEVTR